MMTELTVTGDKQSYLSQANFEHYFRIANMMSKSDMTPKGFKDKPQDILIAMELGRTLNLAPLQAIQNIAVINGRPSVWGDAVLAICSGHPEFEDITEEPIEGEGGITIGYCCTVKRKGRSAVIQRFTIDDAKVARLWGKQGPWSTNPSRMLQMRARSFALRDAFADALGGVKVAEEVQDYREVKDITPKQERAEKAKGDLLELLDKNKEVKDD